MFLGPAELGFSCGAAVSAGTAVDSHGLPVCSGLQTIRWFRRHSRGETRLLFAGKWDNWVPFATSSLPLVSASPAALPRCGGGPGALASPPDRLCENSGEHPRQGSNETPDLWSRHEQARPQAPLAQGQRRQPRPQAQRLSAQTKRPGTLTGYRGFVVSGAGCRACVSGVAALDLDAPSVMRGMIFSRSRLGRRLARARRAHERLERDVEVVLGAGTARTRRGAPGSVARRRRPSRRRGTRRSRSQDLGAVGVACVACPQLMTLLPRCRGDEAALRGVVRRAARAAGAGHGAAGTSRCRSGSP